MAVQTTTAAVRAIEAVLGLLEDAGVPASRDAGAFYPQPLGVIVGLPALVRRTHGARVYEIPVSVVSGDPLNSELAVDRLYALADECALALVVNTYRPGSWQQKPTSEPLPAIELLATATASESEA
jgi:hypothetical protein